MSRWVLLGICLVFGAYVLSQLWPGRRKARRAHLAEVREARKRASSATTPHERADALADAGEAAAKARRWTSAAGLFLRALRADPTRARVVARVDEALGARPRIVESILWRRLAALPDDDAHRAASLEIATRLAAVYEHKLRDPARASVLRRLAAHERDDLARRPTDPAEDAH
jgi:hypothetical protein